MVGEYGADGANRILLGADVVLVVGSALGSMTTRTWSLIPPEAQLIQVDIDGAEIGRNFECAVPLVGDAGAVIGQLAAAAGSGHALAGWAREVADVKAAWRDEVHGAESSGDVPIRPERLFRMVGEEMAGDGIVVGDTGHVGAWSARHLGLSRGQSVVRAAGSLGWGLPASLGVKSACPDREVICLTGDGGFFYHIAELETARRYGLNVIVVVNDNTSLNQEQFLWDTSAADQDKNWRFYDTDLVAIAKGFGCHAARVDDPGDFAGALDKARASGLPAVIDVRTDPAVTSPPSFGPKL